MATLPGSIVTYTSLKSLSGFDTDTIITAANAQNFFNDGYSFCLRYISLGSEASGDLTYAEAYNILESGLALMVVQHVRSAGWSPTGSLGTQDGTNAVNNCKSIGLPSEVTAWCDLEGVSGSSLAQDIINYCNNWHDTVNNAGYVAGLYVGANCGLTSAQLGSLKFAHFWKSASNVPGAGSRGYQMVQYLVSGYVNGISIDGDTIGEDSDGGTPNLLKI
jgi:hypothetical protein